MIAARGLEPYSLTETKRKAIVQVSEKLPTERGQAFFAIADVQLLATQRSNLREGVNCIKLLLRDETSLKAVLDQDAC